jgi:hypothetical protein
VLKQREAPGGERNNHRGILRALALMQGGGEGELIELLVVAVSVAVDLQATLLLVAAQDSADVAAERASSS